MATFLVFGVLTVLFFIFLSSLFKEDDSVRKKKEKNKRIKKVKNEKVETDRLKYRDFVLSQFNNTNEKEGSTLVNQISSFYNLESSEARNRVLEFVEAKLISPKDFIEDVEKTLFEIHNTTYDVDFRFPTYCHFLDMICASQEFNKGVPRKWQREAFKHLKLDHLSNDKNVPPSIGTINFGIVKQEEANTIIPSLEEKITDKYGLYLYLLLDDGEVQKNLSSEVNNIIKSNSIDVNSNFSAVLIALRSIHKDKSENYYRNILNELEQNKIYQLLNSN